MAAAGNGDPFDCVVVGGGPAGLTAALYLRRFHRRIVLLDAGSSRACHIDRTHNYPGFPQGISGDSLLARMREQLTHAGGELMAGHVHCVAQRGDQPGFVAQTDIGTLLARTVLLATGVVDNEPRFDGVEALRQYGLLRQCPVCDGHEFSNRRLAVIGCGSHGAREALFLRHFSKEICLLDGGGAALADAPLGEALRRAGIRRLGAHPCWARVTGAPPQRDAKVELGFDDGSSERFEAVYVALGARPRADLAEPLGVLRDARDNIVVDAHCRTSVEGLFAAGDVVSALDQLAVAVGHGAVAATAIHNLLQGGGR